MGPDVSDDLDLTDTENVVTAALAAAARGIDVDTMPAPVVRRRSSRQFVSAVAVAAAVALVASVVWVVSARRVGSVGPVTPPTVGSTAQSAVTSDPTAAYVPDPVDLPGPAQAGYCGGTYADGTQQAVTVTDDMTFVGGTVCRFDDGNVGEQWDLTDEQAGRVAQWFISAAEDAERFAADLERREREDDMVVGCLPMAVPPSPWFAVLRVSSGELIRPARIDTWCGRDYPDLGALLGLEDIPPTHRTEQSNTPTACEATPSAELRRLSDAHDPGLSARVIKDPTGYGWALELFNNSDSPIEITVDPVLRALDVSGTHFVTTLPPGMEVAGETVLVPPSRPTIVRLMSSAYLCVDPLSQLDPSADRRDAAVVVTVDGQQLLSASHPVRGGPLGLLR
ncbi:hypothetical protein GIS00_06290 [Nakamurella sp. YIM 132087]|uniref:Uncharacterized protein n=1 Tax=Nakamurella alba TaxID=2665158 RepID=A0A7K1FJX5_9ACTN|nr:hypothetical protein [Nakamurella alba]MTD13553.1 hypothetical protein [Nakamurella alba]